MQNGKQTIVILGAGFAGIRTTLSLSKFFKKNNLNHDIILVDEHNFHVYTPDLYEIATAFHAKITPECLTKLKETVATPIYKILKDTSVKFIRNRVNKIDTKHSIIHLKNENQLKYDYLVVALGSTANYYNIPGLEENAFPLKNITNALAINCHVDNYFQRLWSQEETRKVSICIGGGGATGVEFAAEIPSWIKMICKKYSYPPELVSIHLIEAGNSLAGLNEKGTKSVMSRLRKLDVQVHIKTRILKATNKNIEVESPNRKMSHIPADIVFWTGGICPNPLIKSSFETVTTSGALPVNEFLQNNEVKSIFAAGDNAHIIDHKTLTPVPKLAQAAYQQGYIIAKNITANLVNKNMTKYEPSIKGIITPLGGKYAIFSSGKMHIKGFLMWVARRFIDLRYAMSILPFFYALKKWISNTNVFVKND